MVTAGAWDVPPAWSAQLAPGGRLVVPLRMRGLTRTLALDPARDDGVGHLVARSARLFGFVPVRGLGAHAGAVIALRDGKITLVFDDHHHVDPDPVAAAFTCGRVESSTLGRRAPRRPRTGHPPLPGRRAGRAARARGIVIDKRHRRVVLSWPDSTAATGTPTW